MTDERPWRDPQRLVEHYWEDGLTQAGVADELDCSTQTVYVWMNRLDVPTRAPGPSPFDEPQCTMDERLDPPPALADD